MMKRYLRDAWEKVRPLAIPLAIILVLVAIALLILAVPAIFSNDVSDTSDRIALATFFIEAAGVVAILIAVWEFGQSQRGPRLRLHLKSRGALYDGSGPVRFKVSFHSGSTSLPFSMFLENHGKTAARWIQVKMTLVGVWFLPLQIDSFYLVRGEGLSQWKELTGGRTYLFIGGDDYVAYPRRSKVESREQWLHDIGSFIVSVSKPQLDQQGWFGTLTCSVWADRTTRHDQEFKFRFESW